MKNLKIILNRIYARCKSLDLMISIIDPKISFFTSSSWKLHKSV